MNIPFCRRLEHFNHISKNGRLKTYLLKGISNFVSTHFCQIRWFSGSYFPSNVQIFYHILDGIRCIAFKPDDDTIFLVGTDEGLVYKCTTEYSSKFLNTYQAHDTPVYNIVWNTYVPSIFITSGAEWHVKIWDHQIKYDYLYCLQITPTYKIL